MILNLMETNRKVKETFYKMVSLEIPRKKRREYIEEVYDCFTLCGPKTFNGKLDEFIKKGISNEEAISNMDKIFQALVSKYPKPLF